MIASALFTLCARPALRAINEVFTTLGILEEFFLVVRHGGLLLTGTALMPRLAAFEAHLEATCADGRLPSLLAFLDVADAVWERAPAKRWVQVDNYILMKAQVLGKDVLAAELADILARVYLIAAVLHTRDLEDATLRNLYLQVVLYAILALQVPTAQTKHVLLRILRHIHRTCHQFASMTTTTRLARRLLSIKKRADQIEHSYS